MLDGGWNGYKLPHIGKGKICREGTLHKSLLCSPDAIAQAKSRLS